MTWFYLSLLSIFALATAELTQQHLLNLRNAFSVRTSVILTFLFQALMTLLFIFIFRLSGQLLVVFNSIILPKLLVVTFISSFATIFYLRSFKVKNISFSAIFISFSMVVSTLMGIIFFSESTSYLKFLGIFLILVAIIITNYKNAVLEKNHFYGLLAGFIFGVSHILDKSIVLDIHPLVYMFWLFLLISAWSFLLGIRDVINSLQDKNAKSYKPIVISGIGYFLFNFLIFTAYKFGGEVGRIDAINNSQIFLIILFEFFILKHTEGTFRKIFSASLAIIGIFMLGLVK